MERFLTSELAKYHFDRYLTSFLKVLGGAVAFYIVKGIVEHNTVTILWDGTFWDSIGVAVCKQLLIQPPIDLIKGAFKTMPKESDVLPIIDEPKP